MCIPPLPDKRERTPLGILSGNNLLPIFQTGAARNSPTTCFDFKFTNNGKAFSDGSSNMLPSFPSPAIDVLSNECLPRDKDFEFVLAGDICEDFDEETLRELDDICIKQSKSPIMAAAASIESPVKLESRPCSMDSRFSLHDPVMLQSGVPQDGLLDLKMRAPERPASSPCLSVTESVSVSSRALAHSALAGEGLGGEPTIAGDSALDKLLAVTDEDLANLRETQYSTVDSITTAEGVPPAISKLKSSPVLIAASSGLLVAQPLTAVAIDTTTCDTELPDFLNKLNESQREAATSDTLKPLLILAGPGSGKVRPQNSWAELAAVFPVIVERYMGFSCLPCFCRPNVVQNVLCRHPQWLQDF